MALESATYISDLVTTNPAGSDQKSTLDDHARLTKTVLKNSFPNVNSAVSASSTELSRVAGVTSAIQTQLDSKAPKASPTFTGNVTVPTPTLSTDAVTKAYADGLSLSSALPGQAGNAGKYITTDGTTASWAAVNSLPSYTGNALKGLRVNAGETGAEWATITSDTAQTLTDGATVNWNTANGNIATLTLGGNRIMAAPTNLTVKTYILVVNQDATGSRTITWNSVFKWAGGAAPVLSTTANAKDVFSFFSDGTNLYGSYLRGVA